MLPGVLLNMIEAAGPIYPSFNSGSNLRRTPLNDMQYTVILVVDTFEDSFAVERSGIAWLAATGWIERGAIECYGGPTTDAIGLVSDERLKLN